MKLEPFIPGRWTKNSHVQTLLGELTTINERNTARYSDLVTLNDGDKIITHTYPGRSEYVVVIGHGLTGSSDAKHVISLAQELNLRGHAVVAINHRNCGDGAGLANGIYHSGRSDDMGQVVHYLKIKHPSKKIVVVGFSMSGNIILRLMGDPKFRKAQSISLPDAAIAVNPPINLGKTLEMISKGFNRVYEINFMRGLSRLAMELYRRRGKKAVQNFSVLRTKMRDFDDAFTGPEGGFKNAEDYYQSCSALQFLPNISHPTFILTSEDDPFVDWQDFNIAKKNPYIRLRIEKHGGHMGYISKDLLPHGSRRWLDYAIVKMMEEIQAGHFLPVNKVYSAKK